MLSFHPLTSTASKLVDHHLDGLGYGWRRRSDRFDHPDFDVADLVAYDDRMLASQEALGALHQAGTDVTDHAHRLLKHPLRLAELFALTVHAVASNETWLLNTCHDLSVGLPEHAEAFDAALAWVPASDALAHAIKALPLQRRLALEARRRLDMPALVDATLLELATAPWDDQRLPAAIAFSCDIGRRDLSGRLAPLLEHPDPEVRGETARYLVMLAPRDNQTLAAQVSTTLQALLAASSPTEHEASSRAAQALVLHQPEAAREVLPDLFTRAPRLAVQLLGWLGDPAGVPTLIHAMRHQELARVAGASVSLITGSHPGRDGWAGQRPDRRPRDAAPDAIPAIEADAGLPWPDADAFAAWWQAHGDAIGTHQRFAGLSALPPGWREVLRRGPLRWRPMAADRLQHHHQGPAFPTDAPAFRQLTWMAGLPA
ncbi:hypothetical protein OU995_16255 [Roseateles sp. SL47]|uniref:hypothetical protein n=1 Tax=Roseateles sp. SL47 TaxID=2995138 RepID=UPI00226E9521|nr:hypothetical protein [Roseateles sp. SL47]WAC71146.1 hypothetical protein OU995_16255 [Roseateles sp. SL47]